MCDDDSCHGLFAMFIKYVGICLVGIRVETVEQSGRDSTRTTRPYTLRNLQLNAFKQHGLMDFDSLSYKSCCRAGATDINALQTVLHS